MSNNNAPSRQRSLTYLIQATIIDNSRGCNAHTVTNNIACKVRLSVLTAERLTTDPRPSQRACKHSDKQQTPLNNNTTMSTERKSTLSRVFQMAWQFVKRNGFSLSEALKTAWANIKLHARMQKGIVKFYYQKVDGSIREAYGTLKSELVPDTKDSGRKANPTLQTYFDTERQEWRCFKVANLIH